MNTVIIATKQIFLALQLADTFKGSNAHTAPFTTGIEITISDADLKTFIRAFSWRGHFKVLTVNG